MLSPVGKSYQSILFYLCTQRCKDCAMGIPVAKYHGPLRSGPKHDHVWVHLNGGGTRPNMLSWVCEADDLRKEAEGSRAMQCESCHVVTALSDTMDNCIKRVGHEGKHLSYCGSTWSDSDVGTGETRLECLQSWRIAVLAGGEELVAKRKPLLDCIRCMGSGRSRTNEWGGMYTTEKCPDCEGTGSKRNKRRIIMTKEQEAAVNSAMDMMPLGASLDDILAVADRILERLEGHPDMLAALVKKWGK